MGGVFHFCLKVKFSAAQFHEQLLLHQYGGGEAVPPAHCEQLLLHPPGGSEAVNSPLSSHFAQFGQLLLHQCGGGGAVPLAQEQLHLHQCSGGEAVLVLHLSSGALAAVGVASGAAQGCFCHV